MTSNCVLGEIASGEKFTGTDRFKDGMVLLLAIEIRESFFDKFDTF